MQLSMTTSRTCLRVGMPPGAACWPGGVDAVRQLGVDILLDVVPQHGEDLLHECVQLLLEQQRRVLGLHLQAFI